MQSEKEWIIAHMICRMTDRVWPLSAAEEESGSFELQPSEVRPTTEGVRQETASEYKTTHLTAHR